MAVGIRCADQLTPLYPQKLALTSPTGGGHSVGIVCLRTKATEFSFFIDSKPTRCSCSHSILFYCKITVHVSVVVHTHHQEYIKL